jgi:hypothetical protein
MNATRLDGPPVISGHSTIEAKEVGGTDTAKGRLFMRVWNAL